MLSPRIFWITRVPLKHLLNHSFKLWESNMVMKSRYFTRISFTKTIRHWLWQVFDLNFKMIWYHWASNLMKSLKGLTNTCKILVWFLILLRSTHVLMLFQRMSLNPSLKSSPNLMIWSMGSWIRLGCPSLKGRSASYFPKGCWWEEDT